MAELERSDMQGIVMSGYGHLPCASYVLLSVADGARARGWLGRLTADITTAEVKQEGTSINIAFTVRGLARLDLHDGTLATFSRAFREGMATEHRSRILGDAEDNAPSNWDWGGTDANAPDILLMLFGCEEAALDELIGRLRAGFAEGGISELRALGAGRQSDSHEHFGFADGIGQPAIEGSPQAEKALPKNIIKPGEVLFSYQNDYGKPADGPLVAPALDPQNLLPDAPPIDDTQTASTTTTPIQRDLGRNGTYLVFRQLAQHVSKFWLFLDKATRRPDGQDDRAAAVRLASKFVGRWPNGAPLAKSPDTDDPALSNDDDFGYYERDPHGFKCPIGAHIRRSNPRDSLGPDPETALKSANRHRLLRRGRSYGHRLLDPRVDDGDPRGLHFICLNSDIERQFEFVQLTWINNPVFGGLNGEVDPLIGHLKKGDALVTVPADPLRTRVHDMQRFVTVRGGAYFFMPGIKALRYLANL
ncbi:MAG TPA: Dyp-type peroxidase [Pyrinomonadaceae bacterium]|nr:Dyp-type peroxidase [Pyrinomonadaceae bacterium]